MVLPWLLIIIPIVFNIAYGLLAWRFSYPGILREPTEVILARFRAGGSGLVLLWWLFALSALAFISIPILATNFLYPPALGTALLVVGVFAGAVQALGLLRWVFLVPYLARESEAGADPKTVDLVFQAFHRYLGVTVGEHLGYLATGAWTILVSIAIWPVPGSAWFAIPGIVIGAMLVVGSLEFVGPFEKNGWKLAGWLVPIGYILWSVWLIALGIVMLVTTAG
jgi:Domain of unknown function (DUF4386)